jgi:GNAT superfamily N-acetyltransferase
MADIVVRQATRADRDQVLAFHRALYLEHQARVVPSEVRPLAAYHDFERVLADDADSLLRSGDRLVFLAEQETLALGYASGHIDVEPRRVHPRRGIVEDWYVSEPARGRGVGRLLLEALADGFRSRGCDVIESSTWAENYGGRAAHAALGFSEVQVVMRKRLIEGGG